MDRNSNDSPASPPEGICLTSDIRSLKENGAASVAEMKAFLKSLKSRNPQEVIGIVSSNLLVQSLVIACASTAIFMVVFTVGPYLIYGPPTAKAPPKKPAASAVATDSNPPPAAGSSGTGTASSGQLDAEAAAKVMGLEETKSADPNKNPLDKPDIDKLLDGL